MQDNAQPDRRFNRSRAHSSRLGDPHMKWISSLFRNQFMGLDAHQHIGGLDADHQIVVSHLLDHAHLHKSALYNAFRRHPMILFQQFLLKGTTVYADPDGNPIFLCLIHNGPDPLFAPNISRINPDLIRTILNRSQRQPVVEMDIRHQRNMNLPFNLFQRPGRFHGRYGHADNIAASLLQRQNLGHRGFGILRLCIAHGLDQNGISSPNLPVSDRNRLRLFSVRHRSFLHRYTVFFVFLFHAAVT